MCSRFCISAKSVIALLIEEEEVAAKDYLAVLLNVIPVNKGYPINL